jgi:hypothetical protein
MCVRKYLEKIMKVSFTYNRNIRTADYFILGPYLTDGNTRPFK